MGVLIFLGLFGAFKIISDVHVILRKAIKIQIKSYIQLVL